MTSLPSPWTWRFPSIIQLLLIFFLGRIVSRYTNRTDSIGIFIRSVIFWSCWVFAVKLCRCYLFSLIDVVEISFVDHWTCVSLHVILVRWRYVLLWWTFMDISEPSLLFLWLEHHFLLLLSVSFKLFHQSFVQRIVRRISWWICFVKWRWLPYLSALILITSLRRTESTYFCLLIYAVIKNSCWMSTFGSKRNLLQLYLKRILHLILSLGNGLGLFWVLHHVYRSWCYFWSYWHVLVLYLNLYWVAADWNTVIVIV